MFSKLISPFSNKFKKKSAIVYYGENLDYSRVKMHNYIIVQPTKIDTSSPNFKNSKKNMYAYVSLCEISKDVKEYEQIDPEWIVGRNPKWNSDIIDIRYEEYKEFLFREYIDPIIESGFENLFFDTLDSYQMICKTLHKRVKIEQEVANFINIVHEKYPKVKIIINRGFEIIDTIYDSIEAVLFESYYFGLGEGIETYKRVSQADREWLDSKLNRVKSYGLPIISVDYLSESDIDEKAQEAINVIISKGMIPYVSNKDLNVYGRTCMKAL
jgi:uncharacterized protein (TIGR01370 family)